MQNKVKEEGYIKICVLILFWFVLNENVAVGVDILHMDVSLLEITKIDITKISHLKSTEISVLGVKLGDSKTKALKLMGKPLNEEESRLYYKGIELFIDKDGKVGAIALDSDFEKKLVGDTKILVTTDISVNKELRYQLLGQEDKLEQIDESETILGRVVNIRYYYDKGIELHWILQFVNSDTKTSQKLFLVFPYYKK